MNIFPIYRNSLVAHAPMIRCRDHIATLATKLEFISRQSRKAMLNVTHAFKFQLESAIVVYTSTISYVVATHVHFQSLAVSSVVFFCLLFALHAYLTTSIERVCQCEIISRRRNIASLKSLKLISFHLFHYTETIRWENFIFCLSIQFYAVIFNRFLMISGKIDKSA